MRMGSLLLESARGAENSGERCGGSYRGHAEEGGQGGAIANSCNVRVTTSHQPLVTLPSTARNADLELAKSCCAGDARAQRDLFHREKRRVHATLYRVLGSNADIDDLVQEAFLEIFRGLGAFRGEASLATWINRVVVRVAYAYIAKRKPSAISLAMVREIPSGDASAASRPMPPVRSASS